MQKYWRLVKRREGLCDRFYSAEISQCRSSPGVVRLAFYVESKGVSTSLSTLCALKDKSVRGDVQIIRYFFETKRLDSKMCILGKSNICDALTKKYSALTEPIQNLMFAGKLPISMKAATLTDSNQSLGRYNGSWKEGLCESA